MSTAVKIFGSKPLASIKEIEDLNFCFCGIDCFDSYTEYAFGAGSNDESWKKDKSSFLLRKLRVADSIAYELYKGGVKVADIIDNTYGTFYPTFTVQPLYVGFVADWSLILSAFGAGIYQVRAQKVILGQSSTFISRKFKVMTYNEEAADGTVRLETFTTGNIISSELNYESLIEGGWYQSVRFDGRFGNETPGIETDKIQRSDREVISVQDKIVYTISLFTELLPKSVKNQIVKEQLLNNRALISDYNLLNDDIIRQRSVYLTGIPEVRHQNRGTGYTFEFSDKKDNFLIRNN